MAEIADQAMQMALEAAAQRQQKVNELLETTGSARDFAPFFHDDDLARALLAKFDFVPKTFFEMKQELAIHAIEPEPCPRVHPADHPLAGQSVHGDGDREMALESKADSNSGWRWKCNRKIAGTNVRCRATVAAVKDRHMLYRSKVAHGDLVMLHDSLHVPPDWTFG